MSSSPPLTCPPLRIIRRGERGWPPGPPLPTPMQSTPPPELFGGGRGAGPPVPLFLRLCSLPNIYFSSDTVCLATVYPERERKRVNDENFLEKRMRERERERERERCGTSRCTEKSEVKDKS